MITLKNKYMLFLFIVGSNSTSTFIKAEYNPLVIGICAATIATTIGCCVDLLKNKKPHNYKNIIWENFKYAGIITGISFASISHMINTFDQPIKQPFSYAVLQNILKKFPGLCIQKDNNGVLILKGPKDMIDAFTEEYGTNISDVLVGFTKFTMKVAIESAKIIVNSAKGAIIN
jgi:hypothetical protein